MSGDSCYQADLASDDSSLTYQEAADFCQSELKGSLATVASEASLSLLTQVRPQAGRDQQVQWWLQAEFSSLIGQPPARLSSHWSGGSLFLPTQVILCHKGPARASKKSLIAPHWFFMA